MVADKEGIVAVSTGEWGSTFEKQIGRTSCGLASALGYTRQVVMIEIQPFSNSQTETL